MMVSSQESWRPHCLPQPARGDYAKLAVIASQSMIRKSGHRFSEKIMLK
jgi:hypothetical protein